jgi:transcriptional regulator with XRE-family HTH domain
MFDFNEKLKNLRGSATQAEIAAKIGVSQSTYAMYESGKRSPSNSTLKKIAEYFEVSLDYLVGIGTTRYLVKDITEIESINCFVTEFADGLAPIWKTLQKKDDKAHALELTALLFLYLNIQKTVAKLESFLNDCDMFLQKIDSTSGDPQNPSSDFYYNEFVSLLLGKDVFHDTKDWEANINMSAPFIGYGVMEEYFEKILYSEDEDDPDNKPVT